MNNRGRALKDLETARNNAKHGDFFVAEFLISNGQKRKSPVFVLSSEKDKNEDVVICSCTFTPPRTDFDVLYELKRKTSIRTNKIYTINRNMLHFKIGHIDIEKEEYKNIIEHVKLALNL